MRTLNRSFGFPFRQLMFDCTLLKHDDGKDDAYVFYDGKEYPTLQEFFDFIKPSKEEQEDLLMTLNKLIKN